MAGPDDLAQYAVKTGASGGTVQPGQLPPDLAQYAIQSASPTPRGASPGFWDSVKAALKPKKYSEESGFAAKQKGQTEALPGVSEGAGLAGGLAEWDKASGGEIAGGVGDILQGDVARGLHRMFIGTGHAMTPMLPILGPGMIAAPVATGVTLGGAAAGGALAKTGAEALGATPEQSQLAGDVGQLVGGVGANKLAGVVGPAVSKARALWDAIPEETQKTLQKSVLGMASPRISHAMEFGKSAKQGYEALQSVLDTLRKMPESAPATAETGAISQPATTAAVKKPGEITPQGWYYLGRLQEIAKNIEAEEAAAAPKNVTPSRAAALKKPVTPPASSDDLTNLLQESLKRAQAAKGKPLGGSLADLQ